MFNTVYAYHIYFDNVNTLGTAVCFIIMIDIYIEFMIRNVLIQDVFDTVNNICYNQDIQ